ncbi:MAG: hypothetical protein MK212_07250 [Saprospiraceae bacterium]|nr:hypothetical protein [Saprospiraceae bacterium]
MIVNHTFFVTFSIIFGILIFLGLSIFVKKKFNSYYGVLFGIILSGFGFAALQVSFNKFYVIDAELHVSAYRCIGQLEYKLDNQEVVSIEFPRQKTGIINNSNQTLIVEKITYGPKGYYRNRPEFKELVNKIDSNYLRDTFEYNNQIPPLSFRTLDIKKHTIDFFFDQPLPETIDEYGSYGNIYKYWLRVLKDSLGNRH